MHITLHLTTGCNMNCAYCYSPPLRREDMTREVIERAVALSTRLAPQNTGIIFFGGEPLMRKDLIQDAIALCRELEHKHGYSYHFKVTTNGLLLDKKFLDYAHSERLHVALSIDGIEQVHDYFRKKFNGAGTFKLVEKRIKLLLSYQPYAYALMVVAPETVQHYAESVAFLIEKGFRYILASLQYAGEWTDATLKELKRQYKKIAKLYEKWTLEQKKFYLSPFEKKFASHIQGKEALCQQCHFGVKQISIAPDGAIYPCVQFVKDRHSNREFSIGDVWNGIDREKQIRLFALSRHEQEICEGCAIRERCEHNCSCLNWQTTGFIDHVSAFLCESERILIPIVDKLGERLYRKHAPLFIQKHYNAMYPLISYIEDVGN